MAATAAPRPLLHLDERLRAIPESAAGASEGPPCPPLAAQRGSQQGCAAACAPLEPRVRPLRKCASTPTLHSMATAAALGGGETGEEGQGMEVYVVLRPFKVSAEQRPLVEGAFRPCCQPCCTAWPAPAESSRVAGLAGAAVGAAWVPAVQAPALAPRCRQVYHPPFKRGRPASPRVVLLPLHPCRTAAPVFAAWALAWLPACHRVPPRRQPTSGPSSPSAPQLELPPPWHTRFPLVRLAQPAALSTPPTSSLSPHPCPRLQEFGGGLFRRLPRRMRHGVRDAGICHYLAVFKLRDGSLVQFDFGPRGGDIHVAQGPFAFLSKSADGKMRRLVPGEVRERRLAKLPEAHLLVGRTPLSLADIRAWNALQQQGSMVRRIGA